ncbi:hypothetical protein HJB86_14760 [Rhizobium sp. NZLR3b]|uniref:hypothetical protein n=1 Tax=Rhizobium sp. NZLR3b TaxID=2731101 RepID=UPI001C83106C|nr:hypothetical protein [Rhizobium sp. NZLR3b]MBX5190169.1 hypothetical protein [Rhizobium sp. NZLR3b]
MRTAADHLRKHPNARPSTLSFIEWRNAVVEQLKREAEASHPRRKSIIERFMPWFGRRA